MEVIPDDMWSPFKQMYKIIEQTILSPTEDLMANLEMCLKRNRQVFANLLKNPPKNERNRKELQKHIAQGIPVTANRRTLILSKDLVDECFIISDMFDLDEYLALELLCTAQRQINQYPELPRGLIAVLLYYDGRKAVANSVRDLFQIISGVSWVSEVPKELISMASSFSQSLVDDSNILERIVDLLDELDITSEMVLLTKNRALGSNKHRNQISELFEEIRMSLAMALFNWSAQRSLPKNIVIKLLKNLSKYKSSESTGMIDDTTLTMLMSVIYSYDTNILQKQDDNRLINNLNIIKDNEFIQQLYMALMNDKSLDNNNNNGIKNFIKFSFGLAISGLRHASQYLQNSSSIVTDYDEQLVDDAICSNIFKFIHNSIIEKDIIYKNQFFYRRIHMIFTDFIDFMHSKVTELRGRADETAKTLISFAKEGLEPPSNLDHNFEMLLLCIGKFYKGNKAGLGLCVEYWGPLETSANCVTTTRSVSLFKFIRLAGELLPSTLFVPYLKMIAGLASCDRSARCTFNLLKQASGLTGSTALSWEHFFSCLNRYYTNLKQEYHTASDTIYRSRISSRNINPDEIEGLRAVLEVIKAVTTYDDVARIAICEHPNWNPLYTLIGLLGCSVPLHLKADILQTLAALAQSKETATLLWDNLEASQIIATIPTNVQYEICNLEVEIEQNECRLEKYPLSEGILDLLYSLITTVIPKHLGNGPRKPGFEPYLKFLINGIFLKFYNRTYKDAAEKWNIGSKCLKIIHYLLDIYAINPKDFAETFDNPTPPGFYIMLQLHTKSDMLRLILQIIDDSRLQLDDCKKFKGKSQLEECALYCLKIVKLGLKYQDIYFDAHSNANSAIMLSGLNKILLDVNPRSKKPDHILNSTYFLTFFNWLPFHTLEAIKILHMISNQPSANSQIVGIFTQNETTKTILRQGFVECLESEYIPLKTEAEVNEMVFEDSNEIPKIKLEIKEAIIRLIQSCLCQHTPNLGQFLMGFEHLKDMQMHKGQRHGILEMGINCTKSIVSLLENHLEMKSNNLSFDVDVERVIERSFELLHTVCANPKTSDQVLRYLRTRNDFLCRYLMLVPSLKVDNSHVINQISNLLKCIAIELKITASNCQLSRFQHISEIFLGINSKNKQESTIELTHFYTNANFDTSKHLSSGQKNNILCELFNRIDLDLQLLSTPQWEFFDRGLIEQILKECEYKTEEGHMLVDLKKMHHILHSELKMVQSTIASGQRRLILQEIESVLLHALKVNEQRNKRFATVKFVESWGYVTEILFSCVTSCAFPVEKKQELIIEILQRILMKVAPNQIILEMSVIISGTILLLLVNLRCCFNNVPESDLKSVEANDSEMNQTQSSKSNTLNLKCILKYILEWIIVSGVASQKLRINLYASLLNCLRIIRDQSTKKTPNQTNQNYITRLDKSSGNDYMSSDSTYIRMAVEVILQFGEKLIEIICHDCVAGHEICKMSALACIDVLLDIDTMSGIMNFISHHGYLSHIVESLAKSDEELCNTLSNIPENMKYLYVYESKMSMLLRLANTHAGAELLLSNKVLDVLSSMRVFDMHPDFKRRQEWHQNDLQEFVPRVDTRYRQILFPALNLCDCLVTTLGTENYSVISQVMHFLLSHCDMIEIVLRSGSPFSDVGLLQEVSFIIGIIARTFSQEAFAARNSDLMGDIGVNVYRIKKLMLSLYLRFTVNDANFKEIQKSGHALYDESTENTSSVHITYFLEIAANLNLFCRNIVANNSVDHRTNGLLFSPTISEGVHMEDNRNSTIYHQYNLGIIINQLKGSVEYYHSQKTILDGLYRQRSVLIHSSFDSSANEKYLHIIKQHEDKQIQLSLCVFIIEQCLYLLWSHLDYYMRYISSNNRDVILLYADNMHGIGAGNAFNFTNEEMVNLKKTLISVFNETFSKKLCSIMDVSQDVETDFNNALLRRIKSIIQFFPIK
ncbi:nuclear pore complex protein Nup205 [Lucilia cuprina]|uniref:nuclear pore complex protein Nup205 n=1 Tax=Lucilia cuprina TaxID=7375 RepID=UPI001F0609B5|nr:nuclear pore complex protein Nup205 [Lucilia cuprina]